MGFHINVYNMPRIESYARAKEEFESRKVIRGGDQSVRRIGDRYEKEKWLRKDMLDGIEVYTAGYYRTDLVRFYPTHKEITMGGYPSRSTQYFVNWIGGIHLNEFEHKRFVPAPFTRSPLVKNGQIECHIHGRLYINADDWYKFNYDNIPLDENQFEQPVKYRFDASQMRELRKPYQKFLKYADTMLKLNNEGLANDEKLSEQIPDGYEAILAMIADEDKTYLSYYYMLRQCQHQRWQGNGKGYEYYVNIGMIKRYLDKMIKLENPQVLVEV
jgi:hypothetical protein